MELLLTLFWFSLSVSCSPSPRMENAIATDEAIAYLKRYGYLKMRSANSSTNVGHKPLMPAELELEEFSGLQPKDPQKNAGLAIIDKLDKPMIEPMGTPKCRMLDFQTSSKPKRSTRWTERNTNSETGGWKNRTITYNWNSKLGLDTVRREMRRAFDRWAAAGQLKFVEVFDDSLADIDVTFSRGQHGDPKMNDTFKGALAHAYHPGPRAYHGDIHFNDEVPWVVEPTFEYGFDFYFTALHEIGHSLGLYHSPNKKSVMFKNYTEPFNELTEDDKAELQKIYNYPPVTGKHENERDTSTSTTTTTTTTKKPPTPTTSATTTTREQTTQRPTRRRSKSPVTPSTPNICEGKFDSISFILSDLFVFKKGYVWRLRKPGKLMKGYPKNISSEFLGLPDNIDAAYEPPSNSITPTAVFFSGDKFWVFDGSRLRQGPLHISYFGLPGYVKEVDAVFRRENEDKTYIFSGKEFWILDEATSTVKPRSPQLIRTFFQGAPSNVDAALTWTNGVTYFFKNNQYWAVKKSLKKAKHNFKKVTQHWLGCSPQLLKPKNPNYWGKLNKTSRAHSKRI